MVVAGIDKDKTCADLVANMAEQQDCTFFVCFCAWHFWAVRPRKPEYHW